MLGRAPRFPLEAGCERRSWWLWAQDLETRRDCGTGLSIPRARGTEAVAWPQGRRGVTTSGFARQNGPQAQRSQGSGPWYEYTHGEKERSGDPSMTRPQPFQISNHNMLRWPHFLCLSGRPLALGQSLLSLQWLMVAIVLAELRLSRQLTPPSTTGCAWRAPLARPACSAFLPTLSVLSLQPFLSSLCPPEAPRLLCSQSCWPCVSDWKACPPMP